jgi:hypothetical protein
MRVRSHNHEKGTGTGIGEQWFVMPIGDDWVGTAARQWGVTP